MFSEERQIFLIIFSKPRNCDIHVRGIYEQKIIKNKEKLWFSLTEEGNRTAIALRFTSVIYFTFTHVMYKRKHGFLHKQGITTIDAMTALLTSSRFQIPTAIHGSIYPFENGDKFIESR